MARVDLSGPRCTERVPERLCGGLKGDQRPVCRRLADHGGKCKAQKRLRGVGNTSWEWKPQPEGEQPEIAPTFLEPQVVVRQWAPKESFIRPTCSCDGLKHKCKRYRGLLR